MFNKTSLPHNFNLRPYQQDLFDAFFREGNKRIISVMHRRAGKDKVCLNLLAMAAQQRVGTYLYLFPELNQARRVIWQGIDRDGFKYIDHIPYEIRARTNNTEMLIQLNNGSIIQLAGSDNYNSLMGTNPIGIIFSEYSLQNPMAFNYLRPILAENKGWGIFQYTPRGRNHGYDLYNLNKEDPEWYVQKLSVDQTKRNDGLPVLSPEMIENERKAGMPEEMIQQEFYVSFDASMVGSYYGQYLDKAEKEGRVLDFEIEKTIPVDTYWDLGMNDSTVIWFVQKVGNEIRLVDYYENNNQGLKFYVQILDKKRVEHGIRYGRHWAPHDIKVRELGTGRSRLEVAYSYGLNFAIVPNIAIIDGIQAVRSLFSRFWFHKTRCDYGLNCLRNYHKKYDDKKKIYADTPTHDWSSHGSDAFRYLAVAFNDQYNRNVKLGYYDDWDL